MKSELNIRPEKVYILGGDEVVVTKSGKQTHGLGRFFSSLQNQVVPSLCFINLSLIDVDSRKAYPLIFEQLIRKKAQQSAPKADTRKEAGKKGRPKGSKNKNSKDVTLSDFQQQLQGTIRQALKLTENDLKLSYFVYDGALGNHASVQMVAQTGLFAISKLRHDSSLYFPYTGEYSGRGPHKKYGDKLSLETLSQADLRSETLDGKLKSRIYQTKVWHKKFSQMLNVVMIVKTNLRTGRTAKVLLFSNDLDLSYDKLIDYYSLRFQIEFNFRDAKQYWGLEDFMNIKQAQVENMANFSLFMVTFSQLLLARMNDVERSSMLDLKTIFRARKYTRRIINSLGIKSEDFLINNPVLQSLEIGRIHVKVA